MANLKVLLKDTVIYGVSSIFGRFLNYLLVPLYTYTLKSCSDYGIYTDIYSQTALLLVILTFGMESTFFRFINKEDNPEKQKRIYTTALLLVGMVALIFVLLVMAFLQPIANIEGYGEHKWYIGMMALVVAQDAFQAIIYANLRNEHKSIKFACLKMLFIFISVMLNLVAYLLLPNINPDWEITVKWAFVINLVSTTIISLIFLKDLIGVRWFFWKEKAKEMLLYTWPLLVLGIAGILNQVAGQILLPRLRERADGLTQLGIYEAGVKIAMIMALITQAFRYAYEPFVFGSSKEKDNRQMYAVAMKYFIGFTLAAFLCVIGYMDILKFIVGTSFREGLQVVPVVMAAEIMMGIVVNLSFWYKLTDKTIYGAFLSIAGCVVLFVIDIIFIPRIGYWACAWGGVAGYGTTMILSYILGQKHYAIPYDLKSIGLYLVLASLFSAVVLNEPSSWSVFLRLALNTLLVIIFVGKLFYDIKKHKKI